MNSVLTILMTKSFLVPNDNYCKFENWVFPLLDEMLKEQKENGTLWTPSKVIERLGLRIENEESIYYWAAKNKIPVFSPALTDGKICYYFCELCKKHFYCRQFRRYDVFPQLPEPWPCVGHHFRLEAIEHDGSES